jgi:hypothetical protein
VNETVDAFPLCWPAGWPRHQGGREWGQFKGTPGRIRDELIQEIDRLVLGNESRGYTVRASVIISSNIPTKRDGMPMANAREPEDPGIAVYFERKGKRMCFACDKYDRTWKNMRAIAKTIEALRGIERWGSSDMMERAFTGFAALPAPGVKKPWHEILDIAAHTPTEQVRARYRELAKRRHPDAGGSNEAFAELNSAWQDFQRERGLA